MDLGERTNGVEASGDEAGGVAVLDDHNARVVVMVEGLRARLPHLLVRDGAVKLEERDSRILERRRVGGVGGHPGRELVDGDGGAEVDDISDNLESSISITAQSSMKPSSRTSRLMGGDRTM